MIDDGGIDLLGSGSLDATGSHSSAQGTKLVKFPIGNFVVIVRLTDEDQFVGIEEIEINRSFIGLNQMSRLGSHDVDEFYRE